MIKRKGLKRLLTTFLVLCLILTSIGITFAASLDDQKKELSSMQDNYSRAVEQTNKLKNQLASMQASIRTKNDEKNVIDREITVLTEQLMTAESLISEYELYIADKEVEISTLQEKKLEQEEMLGEMLRMSYKYGTESYIDIILGAESIVDFLQRLDFLTYHMKYSTTLLSEMQETTKNLEEISDNLSTALLSMSAVKDDTEKTKAELEVKLARSDALIAAMQADARNYQAELNAKEKDRIALENDIKALAQSIAAQERANGGSSTPSYSGGKLGWPLLGISPSRKTSSYGWRTDPLNGSRAFHNGMDVGAPYGTKILAAEAGVVSRASWYSSYGNCVIINHGNGLMTLYAHASGYNVKVGDVVNRGDCVAFVGSTGRSTGNHLHFTVFVNGATVNPLNYLD